MVDRALRFDLLGRDKTLGRSLAQAEGKTKRFGLSVTKVAGLISGAFAGIAVAGFLKGAIEEGREAAKVGRQTAAVIKATGGAAHVTAKDVNRLTGSLMRKVAVDDDIIATGANMLLTFKGVRNEVGKGNDIFDQATVAALDMTAALNKGEITQEGLQSSSIRLGRALNDPLKGVTALTRVGVTFTQGQKDQIKALVEAGDKMGAQKIILKELGSEFGGAAKAAVDPWQRVSVVMGEVKERIGTALLPALATTATFITDKLIPAVGGFVSSVREKVGPAIGALTAGIQEKFDAFKLDAKVFGRNLVAKVKGLTNAVIGGFQQGLKTGDWSGLGEIIGNILRQAVGNGVDLMKRAFGAVDWFKVGKEATFIAVPFAFGLFDSLLSALWKQAKEHPAETASAILSLIPLGRIAGGLAKIFGKLPIVGPLLRGLERAGGLLEKPVGAIVGAVARFFGRAIEAAFPGIGKRIGDWAVRWVLGISSKFGAMRKAGGTFIRVLVDGIVGQAGLVIRNIVQVIGWLTKPFRAIGGWLVRRGIELVGGLVRGIGATFGTVGRYVGAVIGRLTSPFRSAGGWLIGEGRSLISGLVSGIRSAIGSVGGVLRSLRDAIVGGIKRLFGIRSPSTVMAGLGANMVAGLVRGLISNQANLRAVLKSISGNILDWFGGALGGIGQGGTSSNLQKLAQRMAAGYGWSGAQWSALRTLVQHESGWNPNAQNPTSTAYGLFQFLDSTWSSVGAQKTSSPVGQIAAGLRYIKQRYGSPVGAWNFWQGHHWYGKGVEGIFAKPTLIGVGERGPEAVSVQPLGRRGAAGGIDEDRLARKIAAELAKVIPTTIAVDDVHAGLLRKRGRNGGMVLGLDT